MSSNPIKIIDDWFATGREKEESKQVRIDAIGTDDDDLYLSDGSEQGIIVSSLKPLTVAEITWLNQQVDQISKWSSQPEQLSDESYNYLMRTYSVADASWNSALDQEVISQLRLFFRFQKLQRSISDLASPPTPSPSDDRTLNDKVLTYNSESTQKPAQDPTDDSTNDSVVPDPAGEDETNDQNDQAGSATSQLFPTQPQSQPVPVLNLNLLSPLSSPIFSPIRSLVNNTNSEPERHPTSVQPDKRNDRNDRNNWPSLNTCLGLGLGVLVIIGFIWSRKR